MAAATNQKLREELERIGQAVNRAEKTKFSPVYLIYLDSPEWQARRERIKPKQCGGCNATTNLQLHHRIYPPKGAPLQAFIDQPDSEFTWFCSTCHNAVTQSMRARRQPKRKIRKQK